MKKELTKEELRNQIEKKISKAKPMVKGQMMAHVKRADKKELKTSLFDFKALQFAIWDYFSMVLSYFKVTLFTQNNTVVSFQRPAFGYRYAGDSIGFSQADIFTALSTPRPPSVISVLPILSHSSSTNRELHNILPPSYVWHKYSNDDYWYYSDDKWTGIVIFTISRLRLSTRVRKYMKLNHPSYRITFCPYGDSARLCHLVEAPTLGEAKKMAERYYEEWIRVNYVG